MQSHREIAKELTLTALPVGVSSVVTNLTAMVDMWTIIGCIAHFGYNKPLPVGIAWEDVPNFVYGSFAGIALTVFNLVPSVTNMLGKGALPCITSAWAENDKNALEAGTYQALVTSALLSVPAAFGIGVLAPEILGLLFPLQSDEVQMCIMPLRLLMPGMVCLCVSFPLFSMLQAVGRTSAPLKIMLAGTAVKLLGNISLVPFFGADGAALATSLCYAVILCLALTVYIRVSGVKIKAVPFLEVLYAGAMCGGGAYLTIGICRRFGIYGASSAIPAIAAGAVLYIISVSLLSVRRKREALPCSR
jgi:stage V sporulation protein B